jgi:hypothetical protein
MKLDKFSIEKDDGENFHVSHPSGKKMVLSKKGLSPEALKQLNKMGVQNFDEGSVDVTASPTVTDFDPNASNETLKNFTAGQAIADQPPAPQAPAPAMGPQPAPLKSPMDAQQDAYDAQMKANTAGANAISQQGAAESMAAKEAQGYINQGIQSTQDIMTKFRENDDDLMQAYKDKKIDPDQFWKGTTDEDGNKVGGHSKVLAAIGIALGGPGAWLNNGQNVGMQVINKRIDADIDAQKNDQSQAMNLWKMNKDRLGTDLAADAATRNQLLTGVQYKMQQAAAVSHGQQAQANAQGLNAQIEQQKQQGRFKMSLMNPTSDNPDPSTRVQYLVPPAQQQKVYDEIDAAKNTASSGNAILGEFDKAASTLNAVDFIPGMQNVHQKAMHALMGPTFKDVEGTVRQAAMDNMNDNTTPAFGDSAATIATKRRALEHYLGSKSSASTALGNGIDLRKFQSTNFNPAPANMPQQGEIQQSGGVNYIKVPGGWKPVQ